MCWTYEHSRFKVQVLLNSLKHRVNCTCPSMADVFNLVSEPPSIKKYFVVLSMQPTTHDNSTIDYVDSKSNYCCYKAVAQQRKQLAANTQQNGKTQSIKTQTNNHIDTVELCRSNLQFLFRRCNNIILLHFRYWCLR